MPQFVDHRRAHLRDRLRARLLLDDDRTFTIARANSSGRSVSASIRAIAFLLQYQRPVKVMDDGGDARKRHCQGGAKLFLSCSKTWILRRKSHIYVKTRRYGLTET